MYQYPIKRKYRLNSGLSRGGPYRTRTGPHCCTANCPARGRFYTAMMRALYASRPVNISRQPKNK